jgi:multiple sugar transport system substrate-binding protein
MKVKAFLLITVFALLIGGSITAVAQDQVTLTFWSHTHPPMVTLNEALVAEYMEANPNVTIEYTVIPNNQFFEQMYVSMTTGVGPDIINMGNSQLVSDYIPRDLVSPVDPSAFGVDSIDELKAMYVPNALEGAQVDGTYYGIPSEINTDMLAIYTPDLVAAGYPEDWAPATWDELGEVAGALSTFDESGAQTHRGFDLVYLHAGWYSNQFQTLAIQTGCNYYNAEGTESTINSPECAEAAQIWRDMIFEYQAANPALSARESTVPLQDYIDGSVSMTFIQPWGMELVRQGDAERWENTRLVPLPQVDPEAPANKINAYYWAVNSQSPNQEEAWKFIQYMSSQAGRWLRDVNFLQGNNNMAELPEAAEFPYADQWLTGLQSGNFYQLYPSANETHEALRVALESILLNDADIQATLDGLKEELDFIVQ